MKKLLALFLLLVVSTVAQAQDCPHAPYGTVSEFSSSQKMVVHTPLCVIMNQETRFADAVFYTISQATAAGSETSRRYKPDPLIGDEWQIEKEDYTGANAAYKYEKGHIAALGVLDGYPEKDRKTVNYVTNLTPQYQSFNRDDSPWYDLEQAERAMVGKKGRAATLWIAAGTLYEHPMPALPQADEPHVVPSGFWKIILMKDEGKLKTLAVILDQTTPSDAQLKDHIVSIDDIERRTGLELMPQLPEKVEARTETTLSHMLEY